MSYSIDIKDNGLEKLAEMMEKAAKESPKKLAEAMHGAGEIIAQKQRQIIGSTSPTLAKCIQPQTLKTTKKGKIILPIGYNSAAIKEHPEAVILEFGRPGQSAQALKKGGITNRKANGKKKAHKMKIGKQEAVPHLRKGFDAAQDEATEFLVAKIMEVFD